jgi:hypothetical protein
MEKDRDWQVVFKEGDSQSYLYLNPAIIEELDSFNGDTFQLIVKGVKRYFPTFPDPTLQRQQVGLSAFKAKDLGLSEGDSVAVAPSDTLEYGKKVAFALVRSNNTNANDTAELGQEAALALLLPHFEDAFAPVCAGTTLLINFILLVVVVCYIFFYYYI